MRFASSSLDVSLLSLSLLSEKLTFLLEADDFKGEKQTKLF
jgi:hypothetical protein